MLQLTQHPWMLSNALVIPYFDFGGSSVWGHGNVLQLINPTFKFFTIDYSQNNLVGWKSSIKHNYTPIFSKKSKNRDSTVCDAPNKV